MGDFSKLSNYNPNANFKLVRIGADCPVLEVELNEMQDIAEGRYKDFIKYYLGDGLNGEGDIIYADNTLTIQNEKAFVGGNTIEITTLKLPLLEGEKAYLKVWEETIKTNDLIKYKGNQQETRTVPNTLLDPRINKETSRRIQVKYDLVKTIKEDNANYLYLGYVAESKFISECALKTQINRFEVEQYESEGSQQVFLTKHLFTRGTNSLSVYVDGVHLTPSIDFEELTNNSFKIKNPVPYGQKVTVVYARTVISKTKEGHKDTHTKYGEDPIELQDLLDNEGLLAKIKERLKIRTVDCGSFNDLTSDAEETYDGGVF